MGRIDEKAMARNQSQRLVVEEATFAGELSPDYLVLHPCTQTHADRVP